jgi:hypothetical protein
MNQESKRPVTVEDLLQLKRNERPAAEFWATFDRELRAKQLAALVEKRPWWRNWDFSRALRGFVRYQLPLGAAAVVAITYVAMRDTHSTVAAPAPKAVVATPAEPQAAVVTVAMVSTAPSLASETQPAVATEENNSPSGENAVENVAAESNTSAAEMPAIQADTPSARYIAANLRAAQQAEPLVARGLLAQAHGFEARGLPAKATVEPLAQMVTPASARIAKLSSAMSFSSMVDKSTRTSDRIAHRLLNDGDDRLYETASRLKVGGDRLGLKL